MFLTISLILLPVVAPTAAQTMPPQDPPVRVWLDSRRIRPGDWARANVRVREDGYLVVLAADASGRVRVVYPLDPDADAFVRGGRTIRIRASGGRGSFLAGDAPGTGAILAAESAEPFRWDSSALASVARRSSGARASDPETMLVDIARQMAGGSDPDYSVATYTVTSDAAYIREPYHGGAYAADWDPWYSHPVWYGCPDPFFCGPAFLPAFQLAILVNPFFIFRPVFVRPLFLRPIFFRPYIFRPYFARQTFVRPRYRQFAGGGYARRTPFAGPAPFAYRGRGGRGYSRLATFGGYVRSSFPAPRVAGPMGRGGWRGGGRR